MAIGAYPSVFFSAISVQSSLEMVSVKIILNGKDLLRPNVSCVIVVFVQLVVILER